MAERRRESASVASCFFGLTKLEISLAGVGCLRGIYASSQAGFFEEVAPAFMGVRRALPILIFAHGGFGVLPALDHLDDSSGNIGPHVVADEDVGRLRIVDCQRGSMTRVKGEVGLSGRVPVLSLHVPDEHFLHSRVGAPYRGRTFSACQPLGPLVTSNSTLWPSWRLLKPPDWIAEKCTKTSSPVCRLMKP